LRYALIFSAGILFYYIFPLPLWAALIGVFIVFFPVLIISKGKVHDFLLILCVLFSGILRCALADEDFIRSNMLEGEYGDVEIVILQQRTSPYYVASYIGETLIEGETCRGTIYARAHMPILVPGKSYVFSSVSLRPVTPNTNPYRFNYMEYAKGKGITHAFHTDSKVRIEVKGIKHPLRYAAYCVRERISVRFLSVLGVEKGSLVNGLLLGMKSEIPDGIASMFRNLGISHLLAVSGLHVGLIVLILYQLLLTLSLKRIPRTILIMVFLIFYCYMTGGSPSVIRSSLMTAMLLMAPVFHRKYQALNAVAATAVILLLVNPFYLRDIGFQFSFAAVFGILIGYRILKEKIAYQPRNPAVRYAWDMLMVSVSAALFTAPVALCCFNTMQIASLFLNIIAIPLTFCVMICAIVSLPCLFIPSFISDLIFHALDLSLELLRGMLRLASRSGIWTLTVPSYWKPYIMAVLLIIVILLCIHNKKIKKILSLVSVLFCLCWSFVSTRPEIIQLALPRGSSILFRNGRDALIINTGSVRFNSNDYHASIQPVLTHWGTQNVTLIVTSIDKTKTGTISHIRRDFPLAPLLMPREDESIETKQTIIATDTSWEMGKYHIDLAPLNGELLSVMIRIKKDSIYIGPDENRVKYNMDPDKEIPKARQGIILANKLYWK